MFSVNIFNFVHIHTLKISNCLYKYYIYILFLYSEFFDYFTDLSANFDDDKKFANAALDDFMLKVEDAENYVVSLARPPDGHRPSGSSKRRGASQDSAAAQAALQSMTISIPSPTSFNASPNVSGKNEKRVTINTEAYYEGESAPNISSKGVITPSSILTTSAARESQKEQKLIEKDTANASDVSDTQSNTTTPKSKFDNIKNIDVHHHKRKSDPTVIPPPNNNNNSNNSNNTPSTTPPSSSMKMEPPVNTINTAVPPPQSVAINGQIMPMISAEQVELQNLRALVQNLQLIVQTQAKTIDTLQHTIESQQKVIMGFSQNNR